MKNYKEKYEYREFWELVTDSYTVIRYKSGQRCQVCIYKEKFYYSGLQFNDETICIHSEAELVTLLKSAITIDDGEREESYTEEEISREVQKFKERRLEELKKENARRKEAARKKANDENRKKPLEVSIFDLIK